MSNVWFRSWHGAPTDPKWLLIARMATKRNETRCNANVTPGIVSAVFWALLDHASQHEERGTVGDFDVETYASFSGFEESVIEAIISAMSEKGLITSNSLTEWNKRQPKREDNSTERVRRHRNAVKRNVTPDKKREDKIRIDKKETRETRDLGDWPVDYREQFWAMWPNKVGKPTAMAKLEATQQSGVTWANLTAGVERYIRTKPPDRSWLNPATFLNQRRFEDQPAAVIPLRRTPDV